jgi:hypothetical protein
MEKRKCRPLADRLWEKIAIAGPDECWLWLASTDGHGYGHLGAGGRGAPTVKAYVVAYELTNGAIPTDLLLRHTCDNPPCCNPRHLIPGTPQENADDRVARGRTRNQPPKAMYRQLTQWTPPNRNTECVCQRKGCGLIFEITPSQAAQGRGKYCGSACYHTDKVRPLAERFWEKVDTSGEGCWLWTAAKLPWGYGAFIGLGERRAHRVAWVLTHGPIPAGVQLRHKVCDNPPCCRPSHMKLGTNNENRQDSVEKGRHARGENSGWGLHPERQTKGEASHHAKLTEAQVREMRQRAEAGETQRSLATEFGVGPMQVSRIVRRLKWKHVE